MDGHEPFPCVILDFLTHHIGKIRRQTAAEEYICLLVEECGMLLFVEDDDALVDILDDGLEALELQRFLALCIEDLERVVDCLLNGLLARIDIGVRDLGLFGHAHGVAAACDAVDLLRVCKTLDGRLDLLVGVAGADENVHPREREILRRLKENVTAHDDGDPPHARCVEGGDRRENVVERGCDLDHGTTGKLFDLLSDTAAADDNEWIGVGEHRLAHIFIVRCDNGDIESAPLDDALGFLCDVRGRSGKQDE